MDQTIMLNLLNDNEGTVTMAKAEHNRSGFTLIELLTVIVIIAILAAIIYPVFSSVSENNRQSTSISNLHDISTKLAEYELDKHQVPPVLFAYAYTPIGQTLPAPMDQLLGDVEADSTSPLQTTMTPAAYMNVAFPGLYPSYIKNVSEFTDPNNPDVVRAGATTTADINTLQTSTGNLVLRTQTFYISDAYDISPRVTAANTIGATYVPRYQAAWTGVSNDGTSPISGDGSPYTLYQRQLHWQFPPASTYVTCTTYHVPKSDTILVLFNSGTVQKFSTKDFLGVSGNVDATKVDTDGSTCGTNSSACGVSEAKFWTIAPRS